MVHCVAMSFRCTPGAVVQATAQGYQLSVPAGKAGEYRLAQWDDYHRLTRSRFPHHPPLSFSVRARVSASHLPGTWGFGLWNDPFGLSLGFGATPFRLPTLPNAIWFFYASPENYLTVSERAAQPANGFFAGVFRSPRWPSALLALTLPGIPFLVIRPLARLARCLAARLIHQNGVALPIEVTEWHTYSFRWLADGCEFRLDGEEVLSTALSPRPPLGLVIWIDNQYAAFTPAGHLRYGTLANPPMWLEIEQLSLGA